MLLASARENSTDSARGGKSEFIDKQKHRHIIYLDCLFCFGSQTFEKNAGYQNLQQNINVIVVNITQV